jgi:flagellar motor switch protein FliN/FliY
LDDVAADDAREESVWWAQAFSSFPSPAIWLGATLATVNQLGQSVRAAIDAEGVSFQDARPDCQELFAQTANALAIRMSESFSRPVTSRGVATADAARGTPVATIVVELPAAPDGALLTVRCDQDFLRLLAEVLDTSSDHKVSPADQIAELELPVHATLGKTNLRLEDIFKLRVGSIIDLGKAVSDPVDLVVNYRVIAQGQVVVCSGNYGIKLTDKSAGTGDDVCRLTK